MKNGALALLILVVTVRNLLAFLRLDVFVYGSTIRIVS